MEDKAIQMPPVKKEKKLPVVLSKLECKELCEAPRSLKHKFLLSFAYGSGLRMNVLRMLRQNDLDMQRMQVLVRQGKGRKDRYTPLSKLIAQKLPLHLEATKPQLYLFEGNTPGQPMGERSIQYIIKEALPKTGINMQCCAFVLIRQGVVGFQFLEWVNTEQRCPNDFVRNSIIAMNYSVTGINNLARI